MESLYGIIVALVIVFFYQRGKTSVAEARNDNLDTLKKVDEEAAKVVDNNDLITSGAQQQINIVKEITDAEKANFTLDSDNDFISKR